MCEKPYLFVNPTSYALIVFADRIFVDDRCFSSKDISNLGVGACRSLFYTHNSFTKLEKDNHNRWCGNWIDVNRVVESSYFCAFGLKFSYFTLIPCGKCDLCLDSNRQELEKRAMFEAASNPYMYFFTLTYDNDHLPSDGLRIKDMQDFFKRFRINIERASKDGIKINYFTARHDKSIYKNKSNYQRVIKLKKNYFFRSFYVGEYGSDETKTRRAHYHGVLFFKEPVSDSDLLNLIDIFVYSWPNARIFDFQSCDKPFACAKYITKYLTKLSKQNVPLGKNPTFWQGPTKDGGLGAYKLFENQSLLDAILNSTNGCVFLSIGSSVCRVGIPRFIIDKLFPTLSRVSPNALSYYLIHTKVHNLLTKRYNKSELVPWEDNVTFHDDLLEQYSFLYKSPMFIRSKMKRTMKFLDVLFSNMDNSELQSILLYTGDKLFNCPDFNSWLSLVTNRISYFSQMKYPDLSPDERYRSKFNKMLNNVIYVEKNLLSEKNDLLLHSEVV